MDPQRDDWGDERAPRTRAKPQLRTCSVCRTVIPKGTIAVTVVDPGKEPVDYCRPCRDGGAGK